jgi:hypothetical protein
MWLDHIENLKNRAEENNFSLCFYSQNQQFAVQKHSCVLNKIFAFRSSYQRDHRFILLGTFLSLHYPSIVFHEPNLDNSVNSGLDPQKYSLYCL